MYELLLHGRMSRSYQFASAKVSSAGKYKGSGIRVLHMQVRDRLFVKSGSLYIYLPQDRAPVYMCYVTVVSCPLLTASESQLLLHSVIPASCPDGVVVNKAEQFSLCVFVIRTTNIELLMEL